MFPTDRKELERLHRQAMEAGDANAAGLILIELSRNPPCICDRSRGCPCTCGHNYWDKPVSPEELMLGGC